MKPTDTSAAMLRLMEAAAPEPPPAETTTHIHQLVGHLTGNIILIGELNEKALEMILQGKKVP